MRFLIRCLGVGFMTGVDATPSVVDIGRARNGAADIEDRIAFIVADACRTGMEDAAADFIWAEDAWCYVVDKGKLVQEAVRLVKPGGLIAFTDWIAGPIEMTRHETRRFLQFMRFPSMANTEDYRALLEKYGATVLHAEDTGRFAPTMDVYLRVVNEQLAFDVLRVLDFNQEAFDAIAGELAFMRELAHTEKLIQGMFVASKASA
jgi:SAM-dependent methyltransferase